MLNALSYYASFIADKQLKMDTNNSVIKMNNYLKLGKYTTHAPTWE